MCCNLIAFGLTKPNRDLNIVLNNKIYNIKVLICKYIKLSDIFMELS